MTIKPPDGKKIDSVEERMRERMFIIYDPREETVLGCTKTDEQAQTVAKQMMRERNHEPDEPLMILVPIRILRVKPREIDVEMV